MAQVLQQDVVYLKNGSVIHGQIIENKIGESIKIQTSDKNIWVFTYAEIDKMTKEEIPGRIKHLSRQHSRYLNIGTGLIFDDVSFGSTISAGYKKNPFLAAGGFISFDSYYAEQLFAPLGIEARGEIIRAPVTPFWFAQLGYPIIKPANTQWETFKPGMMYQLGGGMLFMITDDYGFFTEVGYKVQYLTYERNDWMRIIQKGQRRNVTLKVGLQF